MLLSDSQLSMIPLCSDMLFTPVDYIFVICLTKCLSWLVGVQSRSYSSNFFLVDISLLSYYYEDVILLWAVIKPLGLKKSLKSCGDWHNTVQKVPGCWLAGL